MGNKKESIMQAVARGWCSDINASKTMDADLAMAITDEILKMSREPNMPKLRQRIIKSMNWMIKDIKYRADETKQNFEEGSQGGYSPELIEAMNVLDELKSGEEV